MDFVAHNMAAVLNANLENAFEEIIVTHCVNPSMFWYRVSTTIPEDLLLMDQKLSTEFKRFGFTEGYTPQINELVAVYVITESRYCRARVEEILEFRHSPTKYVLWAIDYGKVYYSVSRHIRQLPKQLAEVKIENIFFGGLNDLLPATEVFDFGIYDHVMKVCDTWSKPTCDLFNNLLNEASSLEFMVQRKVNDQFFGEIKATMLTGKTINLNDLLIQSKNAVLSKKFIPYLNQFKLNQYPIYITNQTSRNIGEKIHGELNYNSCGRSETEPYVDFVKEIANPGNTQTAKTVTENFLENFEEMASSKNFPDIATESKEMEATVSALKCLNYDNDNKFVSTSTQKECKNKQNLAVENSIVSETLDTQSVQSHNSSELRRVAAKQRLLERAGNYPNENTIVPGGFDLRNIKDMMTTKEQITKTEKVLSISEKVSQFLDANSFTDNEKPNFRKEQINTKDFKHEKKTNFQNEKNDFKEPLGAFDIQPFEKPLANHPDMPGTSKSSSSRYNWNDKTNSKNTTQNDSGNKKSHNFHHNARGGQNRSGNNRQKNENQNHRRHSNQKNKSNVNENEQKTKNQHFEQFDETCISTSIIGKDSVLVHGAIPYPIFNLADANFTPNIQAQMEMLGIQKIYRLQQFCWPHVLRFSSLIIVNGEKTGKTLSYLPAVATLVELDKDSNESKNKKKGPIAIIMFSTRTEIDSFLKICKYFFRRITYCTDEINSGNALNLLLQSVEVLVCTPSGLQVLNEKNKKYRWFSKERIKHFIIENIDNYSHEKLESLSKLMDSFGIKKLDNLQIIITSRIWLEFLKSFLKMKTFNNPIICIGAPIEAAIYAKTEFILKIVQSEKKPCCIFEFVLKDFDEDQKTIIITNSDKDVEVLANHLKSVSVYPLTCTNETFLQDINEVKNEWFSKEKRNRKLLICSDSVFSDLGITDAQNLIHYSLGTSWTKTCYRFSALLNYHENRMIINNCKAIYSEAKKCPATTLILLDENNNEQLPKLIKFLERNNVLIDESVRKLTNVIEIRREINDRSENQICSKILEFGPFHNTTYCKNRHVLTIKDAPAEDIPREGEIKFKILNAETPVLYYARLLEHKPPNSNNWNKIKNSSDYAKFHLNFTMYFSSVENQQIYYPIVLNDLCVAVEGTEYYRIKIMEIIAKGDHNGIMNYHVKGRLVDLGPTLTFKSFQLLTLPEKFASFPFQAVELRLLGIIPYDKEDMWDKRTTATVRDWIQSNSKDETLMNTATIQFALMDTIFVNDIILKTELTSIKTYVEKLVIKKKLLQKNLVTKSAEVEEFIKQMAFNANLINAPESAEKLIKESNDVLDEKSEVKLNESSTDSEVAAEENCLVQSTEISSEGKKWQYPLSEKYNDSFVNPKSDPKKIDNTKDTNNITIESKIGSSNIQKYSQLPENEFTEVIVSFFQSPNCFYVRNQTQLNKMTLDEMNKKIQEYVEKSPPKIDNVRIGLTALAEYEGSYQRCKIVGMVSENFHLHVKVYFLDFGAVLKMKLEQLLCINQEILNFMPFQAINCDLVGISSKHGDKKWNITDSQKIYDDNIKPCTKLLAKPVFHDPPTDNSFLRYFKYKIILFDASKENASVQINSLLYNKGLAAKDPETEIFLDINSNRCDNSVSPPNEEWECDDSQPNFEYKEVNSFTEPEYEFEVNFNQSEIEEFLESLGLPKTTKLFTQENSCEKDKSQKSKKENDISTKESKLKTNNCFEQDSKDCENSICEVKESSNLTSNKLLNMETFDDTMAELQRGQYITPTIIWRQTKSGIILSIGVPNVTDYDLIVTNYQLTFRAMVEDKLYFASFEFFSSVYEVSHEIRGLNVLVKLIKVFKDKHFLWPYLISENKKYSWIKYHLEALADEADLDYECDLKLSEYPQYGDIDIDLLSDSSDSDINMNAMADELGFDE